jgi:hypothetical protein
MRNPILLAFGSAAILASLSSCTLNDILVDGGGVDSTETQVVKGLRTALSLGIDSGADIAGKVNGYLANAAIKILLPEDAARAAFFRGSAIRQGDGPGGRPLRRFLRDQPGPSRCRLG